MPISTIPAPQGRTDGTAPAFDAPQRFGPPGPSFNPRTARGRARAERPMVARGSSTAAPRHAAAGVSCLRPPFKAREFTPPRIVFKRIGNGPSEAAVQRLATLFLMFSLSGCISTAESSKTDPKPPQAAANTTGDPLVPEAAAMKQAQKTWPNATLCDDGGYRIRPCESGRR